MSDLPKARLLPGIPFEAKAKKKRRRGAPAPASTCTPPFDEVRPFLTGTPLHGITGPPVQPEPVSEREPATPDPDPDPDQDHDHDETLAA